MQNLKFNNFFAVNVYNKNKLVTVKKESNLNKGDFFIATLKNGVEFALCKVKGVKKFKNYEFNDELETVIFNCKNAEKIHISKKDVGFKDFRQLQKFYNNYFKDIKNGVVIIYDVVYKLLNFNTLTFYINEIKKEEEGEKNGKI